MAENPLQQHRHIVFGIETGKRVSRIGWYRGPKWVSSLENRPRIAAVVKFLMAGLFSHKIRPMR